jgi:hypothetical protein
MRKRKRDLSSHTNNNKEIISAFKYLMVKSRESHPFFVHNK